MIFELILLGPPSVTKNGKKIRLHSLKALGLLAYLVCRPTVAQSRESLATLFWGEYPDKKARQSLRQALYSLRRTLGSVADACLAIDSQSITFNPNDLLSVDVLHFAQRLARKNWQGALELNEGLFLEGLAFDDSPQFEAWLFARREQFLRDRKTALQNALKESLNDANHEAAISYGRQWLTIDGLNENVYRWLMRSYAASGDLAAVVRCFHQCQEQLKSELGVEPDSETEQIYKQLTMAVHHDPIRTTPTDPPSFGYQGDAQALLRRAGYMIESGESAPAQEAAQKAFMLYRQNQDPSGEAKALRELGFICWTAANYGMALHYSRQALKLHRQQGEVQGEASALHNLAEIYRGLNSPRQAITLYEEALRLHWAAQDRQRESLSLYGLAHAYRQIDRPIQAMESFSRALKQANLGGNRLFESRVHHEMAALFMEAQNPGQAIKHMENAVAISKEIGYTPGLAHSLFAISFLHVQQAKFEQARLALQEAAVCFRLMDDDLSLEIINDRLLQLRENPRETAGPPAEMGRVRSYVNMTEGKVYCEYESPLRAW